MKVFGRAADTASMAAGADKADAVRSMHLMDQS
jgi:hypothetical protein